MAGFESISLGDGQGGYRVLCHRCCNEELARKQGLAFTHVDFDGLEVMDVADVSHWFHFTVMLLGDRVALNAWELIDGEPEGYQFQVLGDARVDLFDLMSTMVSRIRRALAVQHLKAEDSSGFQISDMVVRGRISSDPDSDWRMPLLVIDRKPISWEEFGRMLATYEGFHFRLRIKDKSEEVQRLHSTGTFLRVCRNDKDAFAP